MVFVREGALARVTLSRPEAGNAIDLATARALMEVAARCDADDAIRCVLLTGAGRLFCAGGDVPSFAAAGDDIAMMLKEITAYLHVAISRFSRMRKPLVTAINGPAAGAGLSLAVLGDIALAARSAHFTLAYPAVGLSPDGGATWLLPRLIGLRRTQELALLNKRLGAEEAAAIGLVTRAVADDELAEEATHIAVQLVASATGALGATRRLLLDSFGASLEAQMEAESRAIAEAGGSAHGREGLAAFVAKRKPNFAD